jgi:twinkle protein
MGNWSQTAQPCPCGKSSDAYCIDQNGNGFCFSGACGGKYFKNNKEEEVDKSKYTMESFEHRGIYKRTFEKYGVQTKFYEGTPIETAFFYPNGSIQIRNMVEKKFRTQGDYRNANCFGTNVFDKGSKKVITITEGAYDALAVSQMIGDSTASISVRSSSSAKTDCTADYEYINSFSKIIINFDSDEPGQTAALKVASLFDFKKVFNLKLEKFKDANEYLLNEASKEYFAAWDGVKRYTPDNLLSTMSEFRKALKEEREERLVTYPFEQLQQKLFGIHAGEVIVIKGQEGLGKTEMLRAIENQVFKTTKHNVGIIHLEESNSTTLRAMSGYFTEQPILHPEMTFEDEDIAKILELIVGEKEDRFVLHSSFDVEDEDKFIDSIRFMVSANDCRLIFFDHISWLATGGSDKEGDERKKLDRISQRLKLLAKELKFALVMISHVNDDGKTRGSRNITKVANTVIDLTRNKLTEDEAERNKLHMIVEKARLAGATEGPAGFAVYDVDKLMLVDPVAKGLQVQ